ncbi:MAG: hypothetical protein QM718_01295 [Steroidobacteraceae bacterium]
MVFALTVLSGIMDARGFNFAPQAWNQGQLRPSMALLAIGCFLAGLMLYIVAVRFMQVLGVGSAAIQTAIWFVVTAIGVGALDGSVGQWTRLQQLVALLVVLGLGWLVVTTRDVVGVPPR